MQYGPSGHTPYLFDREQQFIEFLSTNKEQSLFFFGQYFPKLVYQRIDFHGIFD